MSTSGCLTHARAYLLLPAGRLASDAPTSAPIGTSQGFPSLGLEHICEDCLQVHTLFRGFRHHIIYKPTLSLMCLKLAASVDSYRLFDLIYRTKLWHFWKFLLEGLVEIWTTWCFSCHTLSMLPIGTCMTPNLHNCKLKKTQGHSSQFQRWWHPQAHHPSVNTPFWHCSCTCMGVQSYVHTSVDIPTFWEGSAYIFGNVLDCVNDDLHKLVTHICTEVFDLISKLSQLCI